MIHKGGNRPRIYIDVWNLHARILVLKQNQYIDVTDRIPNGEKLAEQAAWDFGGAINMSGWYPPTFYIYEMCEKLEL